MYIAPTSIVKILRNIPLDNTYKDTLYFANDGAQVSYFLSKMKIQFANYTYIRKENKIQFSFHALNDVVVSKVAGEKLIYMELSTDGVAVNRYTADGLIIATPTGSTGYSISAGGPVVDPCMRLYVATPICAHMLSVRSAVLSSNKDIRIKLDGEYGNADAVVTADGDIQGYIKNADEVIITESEYDFELIKIGEQSFYDTLIKKLS